MKIATPFLAAMLVVGSLGASNALAGADDVLSKTELTPDSYCHLTFPAIDEISLSSDNPVLKSPSSGDIIDFYGPCNEDPVGKNQQESQKHDLELRREHSYGD